MNPLGNVNLEAMKNWYTMQTPKVGAGAPVEATHFAPTEFVGGGNNFFIPEYNAPVITGGTHINGLGVAGEKFDSYKLFG